MEIANPTEMASLVAMAWIGLQGPQNRAFSSSSSRARSLSLA